MKAAEYVELVINCDFYECDRPAPTTEFAAKVLAQLESANYG